MLPYFHSHADGEVADHEHFDYAAFAAAFPARLVRLLALAAAVALLVGLVWRTVFFVDETEYVYVTQFGQPVRLYSQSGLGVKWPYQSLWRFDRRLQMYEPPAREMLTEDKENLTIAWYVCWRIPGQSFARRQMAAAQAEPPPSDAALAVSDGRDALHRQIEVYVRRFLQAVGTAETAENRLEERIQAALAAEIGRTRLPQLVSLEPDQVQLDELVSRLTDAVRTAAAEQFGIEVVDVRIKRFNYPEAVKPAVFAEIRSERERVAVQYRAEGASQKTRIESQATLQRERLLAQARREATQIRGEGEARAIEIYNAAHGKDPEFYELLKTLDTYRAILDEQTTVVLSADSPLLKLLARGLPGAAEAAASPLEITPVTKQAARPARTARSPTETPPQSEAAP